jgi:Fe-S oxidoreductase
MADKKNTRILYWVGCAGSFDPRNQKVSRAMVKIFESAGIDFAVLGNEEMCTGDSARRLGEEYLFETMALKNIETLNQYNFETIVTACPHCFHTLKNEYPYLGGNYHVKHHSQFINELISSEKISSKKCKKQRVTYHDSCYLGRINEEYDAPRRIIKKILDEEGKLVEMQRNKKKSFCCGAGGGNMWHEIDKGERINLNRLQETIDSGADTVATACPFCMIMIGDAIKLKGKEESMEILDIAEMVAQELN